MTRTGCDDPVAHWRLSRSGCPYIPLICLHCNVNVIGVSRADLEVKHTLCIDCAVRSGWSDLSIDGDLVVYNSTIVSILTVY